MRERFVVFAPHPDDEALACGGLIHDRRRSGADVAIVFLTNGDAYAEATALYFAPQALRPEHYVQLGVLRQAEALTATAQLGVAADQVFFLGYPDGHLLELASSSHTIRSRTTGHTRSPYPCTYNRRADYSGRWIVDDIASLLRRLAPDRVHAPHEIDAHPDHQATAIFVRRALAAARCDTTRLCQFVVHHPNRGSQWPDPQAYRPDVPLLPPQGDESGEPLAWSSREVSDAGVMAKQRALEAYGSQRAIINRFLMSFVRTTELEISSKPHR